MYIKETWEETFTSGSNCNTAKTSQAFIFRQMNRNIDATRQHVFGPFQTATRKGFIHIHDPQGQYVKNDRLGESLLYYGEKTTFLERGFGGGGQSNGVSGPFPFMRSVE